MFRYQLDSTLESILTAARIPGAALAIITPDGSGIAKAYGYRDLEQKVAMTTETVYPIASTSKAINATLIGMLVDEGKLAWDDPVRRYLPAFALKEAYASAHVTLRDLLSMRTGLPRHDWAWVEHYITRADLVERLRYLDFSAGFREKFQYCNLTVTAAGHIAEVVAARPWEDLVKERIFEPLGMIDTTFARPSDRAVANGYHENAARELLPSRPLHTEVTAPSGGAIRSTVNDMARWLSFNLGGGSHDERPLIRPETLAEIRSPHIAARTDPSCTSPNATYALGWYVDTYNGRPRLTHSGYTHDVNSEVTLFADDGIGIVSFTNFGFPRLARLINEHVFDALMGLEPVTSVAEKLARYEREIEDTQRRNAAVPRVANARPSHALGEYEGIYGHPGYGIVEIQCRDETLIFRRGTLELPLQHWHHDSWIIKEDVGMFFLHVHHPFDRTSRWRFETDSDGQVAALIIPFESATSPISFNKR